MKNQSIFKYTFVLLAIGFLATSCSSGYKAVKYKSSKVGCYSSIENTSKQVIHSTRLIVRVDGSSDAE